MGTHGTIETNDPKLVAKRLGRIDNFAWSLQGNSLLLSEICCAETLTTVIFLHYSPCVFRSSSSTGYLVTGSRQENKP